MNVTVTMGDIKKENKQSKRVELGIFLKGAVLL
jgi:hypothetical protein